MVKTKEILCCTNNINEILADLKKWNVHVKNRNGDCVAFELQSNNTIYEIELYNYKLESLTYITSFEDLQMKILGKVIWNWR
jgi:hypothetical protein